MLLVDVQNVGIRQDVHHQVSIYATSHLFEQALQLVGAPVSHRTSRIHRLVEHVSEPGFVGRSNVDLLDQETTAGEQERVEFAISGRTPVGEMWWMISSMYAAS